MKILSQKSGWIGKVRCVHCETELEVEQDEVKYGKFFSGMDAEESMDFFVKCPVCHEYVFFDKKKIPTWVKTLIIVKHDKSKSKEK